MEIQLGKKYVRRDGLVTGEMVENINPAINIKYYPFYDPEYQEHYTLSGQLYYNDDDTQPQDLVKEYQEDTVTLRKNFVLEAHSAACTDWQRKIEKELPELFPKTEIEVGEWYTNTILGGSLFCATEVKPYAISGYGWEGMSGEPEWYHEDGHFALEGIKKAPIEDVKKALEKECIKRFGEDWRKAQIKVDADGGRGHSCNSFNPCINYDEVWNKNGILFRNGKWAKKLETPKLKEGVWYRCIEGSVFRFNGEYDYRGLPRGYGYSAVFCKWMPEDGAGWNAMDGLREATHEEVESALISEAKRRGFKMGVKYKSAWNGKNCSYPNNLFFDTERNCLASNRGNECVFQNGKWAEIIEEPCDDKIKVGDSVEILEGVCGHSNGDVGIARQVYDSWVRVEVLGKRSSSVFAPCVDYLKESLKKVNKTELTLEQIAKKFNVPLENLRIKD